MFNSKQQLALYHVRMQVLLLWAREREGGSAKSNFQLLLKISMKMLSYTSWIY